MSSNIVLITLLLDLKKADEKLKKGAKDERRFDCISAQLESKHISGWNFYQLYTLEYLSDPASFSLIGWTFPIFRYSTKLPLFVLTMIKELTIFEENLHHWKAGLYTIR